MKEISVDEIMKKYCKKRCNIHHGGAPCDDCWDKKAIIAALENYTITRKTNSELAEEIYQKALELSDYGENDKAIKAFMEAYELLKKGDD